MQVALLQLNYQIGAVQSNCQKIKEAVNRIAEKESVDIFITSELSVLGYPPQDLLFNPEIIPANLEALNQLTKDLKQTPPILVGFAESQKMNDTNYVYNSVALVAKGNWKVVARKKLLPSYCVFNERRYFSSDDFVEPFEIKNQKCIAMVCEDWWSVHNYYSKKYSYHPMKQFEEMKLNTLFNLSASPFAKNKIQQRHQVVQTIAKKFNANAVYVNQIGLNDELLFDGNSMVYNNQGELLYQCQHAEEETTIIDTNQKPMIHKQKTNAEEQLKALVLGVQDFARKNNFKKALLGLSGGIDSALTLYIAVQALGKSNVEVILMPSKYSSQGSIDDATALVQNLQVCSHQISIQNLQNIFLETLAPQFISTDTDTVEENLQARIRGNLLMAFANKFKFMLLNTGNKSELSVGYCTLYGDMCGALAVLADVWKTEVYEMCRLINQKKIIIPSNIIDKAPSAELKDNQTDQDNLPSYDHLDEILKFYIEDEKGEKELINNLHLFKNKVTKDEIIKTLQLFKSAQFKRKQAPPLVAISHRPLNSTWQYPIGSRY